MGELIWDRNGAYLLLRSSVLYYMCCCPPPVRPTYVYPSGEYLVNIGLGRGTAQKRVTGGRWRRIVLGGVLAGQVVELGGSPRLWP